MFSTSSLDQLNTEQLRSLAVQLLQRVDCLDTLRSGKRAAALMSLIQSVKLNEHDPYEYLKDVLERLPTQKMNAIAELLPHNREPLGKV